MVDWRERMIEANQKAETYLERAKKAEAAAKSARTKLKATSIPIANPSSNK